MKKEIKSGVVTLVEDARKYDSSASFNQNRILSFEASIADSEFIQTFEAFKNTNNRATVIIPF